MNPFEPFEPSRSLPSGMGQKIDIPSARFGIGDVVRHRIFDFRGVVFDVDPAFNNSEEWYQAIPEDMRPSKEQPFFTEVTRKIFNKNSPHILEPLTALRRNKRDGIDFGERRQFFNRHAPDDRV